MHSARLLVEKAGADSRARAKVMHEPLHVACLGNWGQVVKFLLSEGNVDVEAADKNGMRSLHLAVQRNRLEAIRELLKHGYGDFSVAVALTHLGHLGRPTPTASERVMNVYLTSFRLSITSLVTVWLRRSNENLYFFTATTFFRLCSVMPSSVWADRS